MASWHQQQAMKRKPTPLWHETKWTVVSDTGFLSVQRFETQADAETYQDKNGGTIMPPAPIRS